MHLVFEAEQVLQHVESEDGSDPFHADELSVVRVGTALLALAGMPAASHEPVALAWQELDRAEREGRLQLFFDRDGTCRGYAVFGLFDDETDRRLRRDPRAINDAPRSGGRNPWLLALAGSSGQGLAIARQLSDGFLRPFERLTWLRRLNGRTMLKTIGRGAGTGFGARRDRRWPEPRMRFTQFRLARDRVRRLQLYARLQASAGGRIDIATAFDRVMYPAALLQCRTAPAAFLSWAMLSAEAIERLAAGRPGWLRAADWRSGDIPCIVDVLGDQIETGRLLADWRATFAERRRLRLIDNASCLSFVDEG